MHGCRQTTTSRAQATFNVVQAIQEIFEHNLTSKRQQRLNPRGRLLEHTNVTVTKPFAEALLLMLKSGFRAFFELEIMVSL